jgi:hypothetical protein
LRGFANEWVGKYFFGQFTAKRALVLIYDLQIKSSELALLAICLSIFAARQIPVQMVSLIFFPLPPKFFSYTCHCLAKLIVVNVMQNAST